LPATFPRAPATLAIPPSLGDHPLTGTLILDDDEQTRAEVPAARTSDRGAPMAARPLSSAVVDDPTTTDAFHRVGPARVSEPGMPSHRAAVTQTVTRADPLELLPGAPAAVRAAAAEVLKTHQAHGVATPAHGVPPVDRPSKPPFVPKSDPGRDSNAVTEESSSAHMHALKEGTVINGRYRVERLIGRGGMGTVYAVRHCNTDEKLALKLLHPALAENPAAVNRFRTEARAPVRIESEHVVRVVDADVCEKLGQVPFMVMERLKGHDLRSELKRRGALPAGEVVLYLKQVARALDKAHGHGIIHRDLKPANMYVLRRDDGSPLVKVLDFGIAKLTDDAAKELTVAGQVFGTPWYMAPEQARGDLGQVGPATDLWAIGLIAFQLLTGQNYWTADGMAALVGQICYEPMSPPTQRAPHLGPLFDMWFAKACHRDPAQRFTSARELVDQLAQAVGVNQTGPGITTGDGSQRNLDSSLQINFPMAQTPGTPQPMTASANFPSQASQSFAGPMAHPGYLGQSHSGQSHPGQSHPGQSHPGQSIPGTMMAAGMDATNAPLYTSQQPRKGKSSSTMAVALGVVLALLVAGTGFGVYLAMPADGADRASASSVETPPKDKPASAEAREEEPEEGDAAQETAADALPKPSVEPSDTLPAKEAVSEVKEAEKVAPKPTPPPAPIAAQPPSQPPAPYKAPPAPKPVPAPKPAAPKVGNVTF
jgi:eukaryotic-like serine/threonine-protein kinase